MLYVFVVADFFKNEVEFLSKIWKITTSLSKIIWQNKIFRLFSNIEGRKAKSKEHEIIRADLFNKQSVMSHKNVAAKGLQNPTLNTF